MKLLIDSIPNNFNPKEHIPIGLYCFAHHEDVLSSLDKFDLQRLELSSNEQLDLDAITAKESLRLVKVLAKRHYGEQYENHSFSFWKTLYYPLIAIVVQSVYGRQILLEKYLNVYKSTNIEVDLERVEFPFICDNDEAVVKVISSVKFSAWIYSRMLENSDIDSFWRLNKPANAPRITIHEFKLPKRKEWIHKVINKLRIKYVYGFSIIDLIFFNLVTLGKSKSIPHNYEYDSEISLTPYVSWRIDIVNLLDTIIPNKYKEISNRRFKTRGKIFDFSNNLFYDFDSKLQAALARANNNIIISNQHGGHNYGSASTFEFNRFVEYDCDFHISWGPTGYINNTKAKFLPLPSPLLSKMLNKHINGNSKIIWVGTAMHMTPFRMESLFWNYILEYRNQKKRAFLRIRKSELARKFYYRPYPEDNDRYLADESFFKKSIPGIQFLQGDLHEELKQCGLLILDHPGTTWNLAMAMNTPILMVWNKEWFPFNKEADSYLDRFKSLGIYFEDTDALINRMNCISEEYKNFSDWWDREDIQELRKEWMSKYAMADKNWRWIWMKAYLAL